MITDEKAKELVARANLIVAAGFGREGIAFPEHVAVASPLVASVFVMLVTEELNRDAAARNDWTIKPVEVASE